MSLQKSFASLTVSAAALLILSASQAHAGEPPNTFGAGLMLGEPTGFSAEYTLAPMAAIDAAFAYSYLRQGDWQVHSDYLLTGNHFFQGEPAGMEEYFGLGARLKFESSVRFGARIPFGASYQLPGYTQVQFFGEAAPIVDFAPNLSMSFNIEVGARYFF
jgi:hypothetical protein